MEFDNTITAIATGFPAAVATIRISGKDTKKLLGLCFDSKTKIAPNLVRIGTINAGGIKDTATAVFFAKPKSFTGEDMAEITLHGSPVLAQKLLLFLIKNGAKAADKGEFSKRAFFNGKLDLSSAEGILNMINAETDSELKNAFGQLSGGLKAQIDELQQELKTAAAALEVVLDYPEEDINENAVISVAVELRRLGLKATKLAETYKNGRFIKEGVRIAIIGGVNVGKSSLLNALVKKDRAIVTDIAGTTRDTLEDRYSHNGQKFIVVDTAGIRESADTVEQIGMERSLQAAKSADIILAVTEAGKEFELKNNKQTEEDKKNNEKTCKSDKNSKTKAVLDLLKQDNIIVVENKTDIFKPIKNESVKISAKTGEGIDELKEIVFRATAGGESIVNAVDSVIKTDTKKQDKNKSIKKDNDCFNGKNENKAATCGVVLTELRHFSAVNEAAEILLKSAQDIFVTPPDCLAADMQCAYNLLGSITGQTGSEGIIDEIFNKFCVGK